MNDKFEELRSSLHAAQQNGITEITIKTELLDQVLSNLNSAKAHLGYLRESLLMLLEGQEDNHPGECHCVYCNARHALAVSSGYKSVQELEDELKKLKKQIARAEVWDQ